MTITINGSGTITGASTLATTVASPTFTTPNIDSAQFVTVPGTAPLYACRAWVNFNGTGTVVIKASGNVTSITDNGVGDYTVNFTTAMSDANYSVSGFGVSITGTNPVGGILGYYPTGANTYTPILKTTSQARFINGTSTGVVDSADLSMQVFR